MNTPQMPQLSRLALTLGAALAVCAAQASEQEVRVAAPPAAEPASGPTSGPPSASPTPGDWAQGLSLQGSGFGTLGWARSNRDWAYQRFIDRDGTFKSDTLLGGQLDLKMGDQWSATVQLTLSPHASDEHRWQLQPSWAFVAWRPNNDWLLRAGKLRVPIFFRSEQMDVGATYDEVRLPPEIYGIVPTQDLTGAHITRSWAVGQGDLNFDLYLGRAHQTQRSWLREGLPGAVNPGPYYVDINTDAVGAVATWTDESSKFRLGAHRVNVSRRNGAGLPVRPTWVELVPGSGIGYWKTDTSLPGPGVEMVDAIQNAVYIVGTEFKPGPAWKVIAELGRIQQRNTERSIDSLQAYVSLFREIDAFTPYLTLSRVQSTHKSRDWVKKLEETTVPSWVDGTGMLNASMRLAADGVPVYDQYSIALGSSYSLSPTSKLKAEWLHTRAKASGMFDLPPAAKLFQPRSVDVLSVNYSFVF